MDLNQTIQSLVVISWLNNHNNHHTAGYLHLFWFIGSRSYGYGPLSKNHFNHTHPGPKRCFILSQKGLFRQFYPVLDYGFKSIDRPKSHKREHRSLPLSQRPNGRPNLWPQIPTQRNRKKAQLENAPCYFFLLKTGITGPTAGYFDHFDLLLTW